MKKIFITITIACICVGIASAQLVFNERGQTILGNSSVDGTTSADTLSLMKIYGTLGDFGEGGQISFGDDTQNDTPYIAIGEANRADSDQLWVHGAKGILSTMSSARDTIFYYSTLEGDFVKFNCDIRTSGVLVQSDKRFKTDIQELDASENPLKGLTAVSYKLKPNKQFDSSKHKFDNTEKGRRDEAQMRNFYESLKNRPAQYGFIAQDVKKILPELVQTDSAGYMYVDYIGIIPLLVNAVNELSAEVEMLRNGGAENETIVLNTAAQQAGISNQIAESVLPTLYQNAPNPFNETTEIRYALPETVSIADLYIFDMQGKQVKKFQLTERGESNVAIQGSDLDAGMYIYSLIADGVEIDSKRMILTK